MQYHQIIPWEVVAHAWIAQNDGKGFQSNVQEKLPGHGQDLAWARAIVEDEDVRKMYVIGSHDWKEDQGAIIFENAYHAESIARENFDLDDAMKHRQRIRAIQARLLAGESLYQPTLVAGDGRGPFVCFDGSHRLVAMIRASKLVGSEVFVGFHALAKGLPFFHPTPQP